MIFYKPDKIHILIYVRRKSISFFHLTFSKPQEGRWSKTPRSEFCLHHIVIHIQGPVSSEATKQSPASSIWWTLTPQWSLVMDDQESRYICTILNTWPIYCEACSLFENEWERVNLYLYLRCSAGVAFGVFQVVFQFLNLAEVKTLQIAASLKKHMLVSRSLLFWMTRVWQ